MERQQRGKRKREAKKKVIEGQERVPGPALSLSVRVTLMERDGEETTSATTPHAVCIMRAPPSLSRGNARVLLDVSSQELFVDLTIFCSLSQRLALNQCIPSQWRTICGPSLMETPTRFLFPFLQSVISSEYENPTVASNMNSSSS